MRLVSYNTDNTRYSRISQSPNRLQLILQQLLSSNADVICLQEVELNDNPFITKLTGSGWNVVTHHVNKRRSLHMGNLIASKQPITNVIYKSSALVATTYGRVIANVHLKAGLRSGIGERQYQLNCILKCSPDIIMGDFNTNNIANECDISRYRTHDMVMSCVHDNIWYAFDWCYVIDGNVSAGVVTSEVMLSDHLMVEYQL